MHENANDILAMAAPGEEVKAAQTLTADEVRIDVPNFDSAIELYQSGNGSAEQLCLNGGKFRSFWNREKLAKVLSIAGYDIVGGIDGPKWESDDGWLRVIARRCKRPTPKLPMSDVQAIMSMPRIAWTDTMGQVHLTCAKLGINFLKGVGVFWGQVLERMMEQCVNDGKKYILTIDYDSIFDEHDVIRLWQIMEANPDIDAIFPLQIGRDRDSVLLSMVAENGQRRTEIAASEFRRETVECETGHFGLTFIRTDALKRMKHPWFIGVPGADGRWGDDKQDDDIYFWKHFRASGNKLAVSPRVRIGHLQLIITWPGEDLRTIQQYGSRFSADGRPSECTSY